MKALTSGDLSSKPACVGGAMAELLTRRYRGHAAHFICAPWCLFHLTTELLYKGTRPTFLVSSVGDYRSASKRHGESFGPREQIGAGYFYETMVWCLDAAGKSIGQPCEVLTYQIESEAEAGHELMVRKYETESNAAIRALHEIAMGTRDDR